MRVIYAIMLITMSLVVLELLMNLKHTKACIKLAAEKIEKLKQILKNYGE